ncbi:hypothetical protein C9I57_13560 [Trinickia symbiotica]|uniref:Uncharacterized protein n=1 Tax=Trinickia symbiotica TaxID=863227 RepID=A0A2T3XUD2_9BURK|nr:hypothetical protein [Trinickia symbiotica]PTB20129.1 hypothetical protein C9I57_13560 [Trinickia symbiotica]
MVERLPPSASLVHALEQHAAQAHDRGRFYPLIDELMATPDLLHVYFGDRADTLFASILKLDGA